MQPYLTATASKAVQPADYAAPSVKEWAGKPVSRSFKLEIKKAVHTLNAFLGSPDDVIVRKLLDRAHGIALLSIVKVGFVGAAHGGGGLVLAKDQQSLQWSAPCAIGCCGVSIGAQVGGELNTVLLILNKPEAVAAFSGAASFTLGANLGVALGPVGRTIEGTGVAGYSGSAACYAYSMSRGAFAGVALDGTVIFTRDRLNHTFCKTHTRRHAILRAIPAPHASSPPPPPPPPPPPRPALSWPSAGSSAMQDLLWADRLRVLWPRPVGTDGHPASATQLLSGRIAPPRAAEPLYRALKTHSARKPRIQFAPHAQLVYAPACALRTARPLTPPFGARP